MEVSLNQEFSSKKNSVDIMQTPEEPKQLASNIEEINACSSIYNWCGPISTPVSNGIKLDSVNPTNAESCFVVPASENDNVKNGGGDEATKTLSSIIHPSSRAVIGENGLHKAELNSCEKSPKENNSTTEVAAVLSDLKLDDVSYTPKKNKETDFQITISDDEIEEDDKEFLLLDCKGLLDNETPCLLCDHVEKDVEWNKDNYNVFLCHLVVEHHVVIADVNLISDLRNYVIHWKNRLRQSSIDNFCSKILTNCGKSDSARKEEYYLLCDALPEDRKVREELQIKKLKQMLLRQEFERNDNNFQRNCLFCSQVFHGNRIDLFNHMTTEHGFNVGHPDNIVNVREFLDLIESRLDSLRCLLCEHVFKDKLSLREHMRKKLHRKLNPKNKDYDKFYIINYLEFGKNWEKIHQEHTDERGEVDEDWSGWQGKVPLGTCFFCKESLEGVTSVYDHMQERHGFDFLRICQEMRTSFYQQIKMINFIRHKVGKIRDENADNGLDTDIDQLVATIQQNIIDSRNWNHPQYYFPTFEGDSLLYSIGENQGLFEPEDAMVISEDIDLHDLVDGSILTDMVISGQFEEDYNSLNNGWNQTHMEHRRPLFEFPWTVTIDH